MATAPRHTLETMTRTSIEYGKTKSIPLTDEVMRIPAANYFDAARYKVEVDRIFKRVPLLLAPSAELPEPGDFKTMEAAGVPLLLVRGKDGVVRIFLNACSHRGANVTTEARGKAGRFVCAYHGWSYAPTGELLAVASASEFGEVDKSCLGLKQLPSTERSGLIFGILDRNSKVDFDAFFAGYDTLLTRFGFKDWFHFDTQAIAGPNWKVAYDGYLDFYHLPVLHRNTFGPDYTNQAFYSEFGPHQRVLAPTHQPDVLEAQGPGGWTDDTLMAGVWTVFPHISIATFQAAGRCVMISQLLPGDTELESVTVQHFMLEKKPETEAEIAEVRNMMTFLHTVVQDEDYFTGLRLQRSLKAGTIDEVLLGRNEGGSQRFHRWVDRIIATDDADLNRLFAQAND